MCLLMLIIHCPQLCIDAVCVCVSRYISSYLHTQCCIVKSNFFFLLALGRKSGSLLPTCWQLCTEAWRHHHHSAGPSLRYIPRRAVLYCPGNDERKLRKLASLDVDCAVLDCEDGVALNKKV